jgi:ribosomal protein S18 acetylase RimI-like enzyme
VLLRHADVGDVAAILAAWVDADAEPTVTDDADGLRTLLAHAPDSVLVAVDGERIVGTLIVGWDGWRGGFYRLAVVPELRRRGIASRLVAQGERELAGLGARRLSVFAVTGDPGAVHFWRAAGYAEQLDRRRLVKNLPVT